MFFNFIILFKVYLSCNFDKIKKGKIKYDNKLKKKYNYGNKK